MGILVLYGVDTSPPVRTVLLTLRALRLRFLMKGVDLLDGEHKRYEFARKNPQCTVPVLDDGGVFIWDSHAIAAYLVRKYGKTDSLYPKNFYRRAIVDQRLHFDSGVLYPTIKSISNPIFMNIEFVIPQDKIDSIYNAYNFLEKFLDKTYIAGNRMTIADFSILSTVSSLIAFAPLDASKTPKLVAWFNRMMRLPYYKDANGRGAAELREMIWSILA